LKQLLTEPQDERVARIARGREHARKFSWSDHAAGLVKLLEGVA
jgi:hypothetical protein